MQKEVKGEYVLVGNSIGSLVSVTMASQNQGEKLKGVYMVNCSGGMNITAGIDKPPTTFFGWVVLLVTNLLKIDPICNVLFDKTRDPENVRQTLQNIYLNKDRVDDELVNSIVNPSKD